MKQLYGLSVVIIFFFILNPILSRSSLINDDDHNEKDTCNVNNNCDDYLEKWNYFKFNWSMTNIRSSYDFFKNEWINFSSIITQKQDLNLLLGKPELELSSARKSNQKKYGKNKNNDHNSEDKLRIFKQHLDTNHEDDLLKRLSSRVLAVNSAPFDASTSVTTSRLCKLQTKFYLKALKNFDLWAVKLYDSSAKLSSGILNGNINNFGDFDQCLNVRGPEYHLNDDHYYYKNNNKNNNSRQQQQENVTFPSTTLIKMPPLQGQYCLAYLQANIKQSVEEFALPRHQTLYKLVHSHNAFQSDFNDPGHRVPRFSLINWAVCVPSGCTPKDVESSIKEYTTDFLSGTGFEVQVRVEPRMCQITDLNKSYDRNTKLAGLFFISIIAIAILSTIYELKSSIATDVTTSISSVSLKAKPNPWFLAFSLKKNILALIELDRNPNDIESIHGIRFLNALLLLFAHKSMALFFDPYVNRTAMTESLGQSWTVIGRAAAIYTDVFLLFSGLLTSYSIIGRLQRKQSPRLVQEYAGRFLRIVPTLGALILFCSYILPNISSGPQWNLVVNHHADVCKQYWWRNMLFIHNYFGFENMCLTHTHHLGIDTELFIIAPIFTLILWRWPKNGGIFLLTLAGLSTVARFYITVVHKLSNYVYFGTSIKRLFKTADLMYSLPTYRATIYILGIMLGYYLRTMKHYKLTQTQLKIGWYVSWILFLIAFFGPAPMGSINYVYNEYHAAIYAALGPMAWCGLFAWIVFTSHLGYTNLLSDAFSWKFFQINTRLSYAIYLTQFPVFFFNVGQRRYAGHFNFLSAMANVQEYFFVVLTSVILTLLFDIPFQNIKKIIFSPSSNVTKQQEQREVSTRDCSKKLD